MVSAPGTASRPGTDGLRPYHLLWGYRKCGTTSLAGMLSQGGAIRHGWDESNIWLAVPEALPGLFERLWGDALDAPWLVDLSTLTHLGADAIAPLLQRYGFAPSYVVATRDPAARWVSAWSHMRRKRAESRSLRSYIEFYSAFSGLSSGDLVQLEDDLIRRDLKRGVKGEAGLLTPDYFASAFPVSFRAAVSDIHYQFRYFGETFDMLEKRPARFTELSLDDPDSWSRWAAQVCGIEGLTPAGAHLNRDSVFNGLRHAPAVKRLTRTLPPGLRGRIARGIERSPLLPRLRRSAVDTGLAKAANALFDEMTRRALAQEAPS